MTIATLKISRLCCEATHFELYSNDKLQFLNFFERLTSRCDSLRQDVDNSLWQRFYVIFLRFLIVEIALVLFEHDSLARKIVEFEQCLEIELDVFIEVDRTLFRLVKELIDS